MINKKVSETTERQCDSSTEALHQTKLYLVNISIQDCRLCL